MSKIEDKCKQKGVRLTDQRRLIAKVMSQSSDHPDVDALHKKISKVDVQKIEKTARTPSDTTKSIKEDRHDISR